MNGEAGYERSDHLGAITEVSEYKVIQSHFELKVFQASKDLAEKVFELTRNFPKEEIYGLSAQMRDSSRSVAAGIAEAWRRRRYPTAFINMLNESEAEAAETQTWLSFALSANYIEREIADTLHGRYEEVIRMLVSMQRNSDV